MGFRAVELAFHPRSHILIALLVFSSFVHARKSMVGEVEKIQQSQRISVDEEEKAERRFFDTIDANGNGGLDRNEITQYIEQEIGTDLFDEDQEISGGTHLVMSQVDMSQSGTVSPKELDSHWSKIESFLTVNEVAEWIARGVQLPQVMPCSVHSQKHAQ